LFSLRREFKMSKTMICPVCGKAFDSDDMAISRKDNKTAICPECGVREALENMGIGIDGQNEIVRLMWGDKND
jgi:transcription elongation factor Elf1